MRGALDSSAQTDSGYIVFTLKRTVSELKPTEFPECLKSCPSPIINLYLKFTYSAFRGTEKKSLR
jgi:hypothetical protein